METWYRVSEWRDMPETVEVSRYTDKTVWLSDGRKRDRIKTWESYFPTEAECFSWLLQKYEQDVADAKRRIQHAQDNYSRAVQRHTELVKRTKP